MSLVTGAFGHEINNALGAIQGFAEMALEEMPQHSSLLPDLEGILLASRRGAWLVQSLLAFVHGPVHQPRPLLLPPLLKDLAKSLRGGLPKDGVLTLNLPPEPVWVWAAPAPLLAMVLELGRWVGRALAAGVARLELSLRDAPLPEGPEGHASQPSRQVVLGLNLEAPALAQDGDTLSATPNPWGLEGVTDLADQQGWAHGLQWTHRHRLETTLTLPAAHPDQEGGSRGPGEPSGLPRPRVLWVEDDPMMLELGKRILTQLDMEPLMLADPRRARALLEDSSEPLDLLITDQNMPELSGLELARITKALRPRLPIILCTGHGDSIDPARINHAGIDQVVIKPFDKHTLGLAIGKAMRDTAK